MPEELEGIEIVVQDGHWYAYGPITPRSTELYNILQSIGGVSESVSDGVYIFNVEMLDGENAAATLELKK